MSNGLHNGLYDGSFNGQENGLYSNDNTVYDFHMLNFFNAVPLGTIERKAIKFLVSNFKFYGIWDKCLSIYPFIGGTASSHKFNLKDPRDLDASFRLVFSGGWNHSDTGALPNGTNAYADTKIIPSTHLSDISTHLSYYSRTNATISIPYEMGVFTGTKYHLLCCGRSLDDLTAFFHQGYGYRSLTIMPYAGLFVGNRVGSGGSNILGYRNAELWIPSASSGGVTGTTGSINFSIYIGAANNSGSAVNFSQKECSFSSIGFGLNSYEIYWHNQIVQRYEAILGRQIK